MFLFLKYIQPTWYYNKHTDTSASTFVDIEKIDHTEMDIAFSSISARKCDAAYHLFLQGYIPNDSNCLNKSDIYFISDINDNYRFIRKYFPNHWYLFVFIQRIFLLNNPIKELFAFFKNLGAKKVNQMTSSILENNLNYEIFNSPLVKKEPLVSIIIPTLNRHEYLKDALADLEKQDYKNFEIFICDQSDFIPDNFYQNWDLNLHLIKQEEKALWLARNRCIKASNGNYILLFDDDSRVEANWVSQHLKCLDFFNVKISAGVTDTIIGHGLSKRESYFHLSEVFDTGNSMVHREVFQNIGLFDRQFEKQRMGDGEFGLRAYLAGFQLISNPFAIRKHLKVEVGGLREMGSWDAFSPKTIFSPRPVPSTLYLARRYFGNKDAFLMLLNTIPRTIVPYKLKGNKYFKLIGIFLIPIYLPIILIQICISWSKASKKLNEGPLIESLV